MTRLGEGAFGPIIHDVEQHGATTDPCQPHLWQATSPSKKHIPLSECDLLAYLSCRPPSQSVSCQFVQEKAVENSVQHFAEVQVNNVIEA